MLIHHYHHYSSITRGYELIVGSSPFVKIFIVIVVRLRVKIWLDPGLNINQRYLFEGQYIHRPGTVLP